METSKEYIQDRTVTLRNVESVGDYVLPDYLGDVKKVLYTSARPIVMGKYKNTASLDVTGVVNYEVVYLDSEDVLSTAELSSDFDISCPADDSYVDAVGEVALSGYNIRLMGPRKLSARSRLDVRLMIGERAEYRVLGDMFATDSAITKTRTVPISTAIYARGEEKEYREEVSRLGDDVVLDEVKALLKTAEVSDVALTRREDGCEVTADIKVRTLISCKDEMPHTVETSFNFISLVDMDGVDPDMDILPLIAVGKIGVDLEPEEDGVSVWISLNAGVECVARGNTKVRVICDCYSRERGSEESYGKLDYLEYLFAYQDRERTTVDIPIEALPTKTRNILYPSVDLREVGCRAYDGGFNLSAKILFTGIACQIKEDGSVDYEPVRVELPYSENVKCDLQNPDNSRANVIMIPSAVKLDMGDDGASVSFDHLRYILAECQNSVNTVLSSTLTDEEFHRDPSLVHVYYPEGGEELFDIARRFHTTPTLIARDNSLGEEAIYDRSGDALRDVEFLIIR